MRRLCVCVSVCDDGVSLLNAQTDCFIVFDVRATEDDSYCVLDGIRVHPRNAGRPEGWKIC